MNHSSYYAAMTFTHSESTRKGRLFWVYLESTSSDEAERNLNDLRASGVTDTLLIRRGGMRNAISLGLFRSQDSVNRRLAEMNEKGYTPIVVPRYETSEQFRVVARLAAGNEAFPTVPERLLGGAQVQDISCAQTPALNAPESTTIAAPQSGVDASP